MELKRPTSRPPFASNACPQCGSSSGPPFAAGGVCLRCAGVRVLELDSTPPFSIHGAAAVGQVSDLPGDGPSKGASGQVKDLTYPDLPERIGACEIIEELGRGGMGRVFAARQIGLGRIVALKAIPAGQGAADRELRFLREAQTIARLRHPHIVAVHESGRAHGFVYFTMDYVEGGDLAHRLRERPLLPRESADLLRKVAGALAYTHGEGVLHRDLKPSNILLDEDEPRVADFGLAAQLEAGGDLTAATGVLGTPHYLAPEALQGGTAALSVASDVYALGVILFQMLTGRTPFAGASPAELATVIATAELPSPRLFAPAVPRDLETICLKCLERDPARRYASAAALADDLARFLAGEPIAARAPGWFERGRRFAHRHRVGVAAATSAAIVLVAATVVSTALAIRAKRAERAAAGSAATSNAIVAFLENDLLAQAAPGQFSDRDLKLRTVLDRAAQRIDGRFDDRPLVEASLRDTLGKTYIALGEYADAHRHLARALDLRRQQLGADDVLTLASMSRLTECLERESKMPEAEKLGAEVLARQRRLLGSEHPDTLRSMDHLALVQRYVGKLAAAETLQLEALATRRRVQGPEHPDLLDALGNLAFIYLREGNPAKAEQLAEECAAIELRALGSEHPDTLAAQNNLSVIYRETGKLAEAEKILIGLLAIRERQLGLEHHDTLVSLNNLGLVYRSLGKLDEAAAAHRRAFEVLQRVMGPEHRDTLITMANLANVTKRQGKFDEAAVLARELVAIRRRVFSPEHADTLLALDNLGDILIKQGRYAEAEPMVRGILEVRRKNAPGHWLTPATASQLGFALCQLGRFAEAEPLLLEGYTDLRARIEQVPRASYDLVTQSGERLITLYTAWGRPECLAEWNARLAAASKPAAVSTRP